MGSSCIYPAVLLCLSMASQVLGLLHGSPPFTFSHVPFLTVWNAPTALCKPRFGVDLDLSVFNIVHNQNQSFMGANMTIFYKDKLGRYPRYAHSQAVFGGVPQNSSLSEHLRAAAEDIRANLPNRDFQGLAVVDWEDWRPLWERNWDTKAVYWEASRVLVKAKHPDWSPAQVEVVARKEFEAAGWKYMEETLRLGQKARPRGQWGFYGFPQCYNYYKNSTNYTGECPPLETKRNDELFWLWNASSTLYPDMYLDLNMRGLGKEIIFYTKHRVLEAMRVGAQVTPRPPAVIIYTRVVYTFSLDFLSQADLVHTIGEGAALGAAGVVLWGDSMYAKSQASCEAVKAYIDETLGHYLVNVTSAATLCSRTVCSSQGRCQRRDPDSGAYLHLDPAAWTVVSEKRPQGGKDYRVLGRLSRPEAVYMEAQFVCQCYPGWGGEHCAKPLQR
ncbi:hyaluronidase-1 [Osmerus eperlanus]|uniref:hyaluronidase-1 n=1 Tax=Osmerus eperlanus TaxID=29151 RepID=UPI002E12A8A2